MEIRIGTPEVAPVQAPLERRNLSTDAQSDPLNRPAVIVEVGRPVESAGTYNAKGVVDNPAAMKNANAAAPRSIAVNEPPLARTDVRAEGTAAAGGQLAAAPALALRSNTGVQAMASSSPDRAAMRPKMSAPAPNPQGAPSSVLASASSLQPNAVKEADQLETPAQHEDEADAVRKDKDPRQHKGRRPRR